MKKLLLIAVTLQASFTMAAYVDFIPAGSGGIDDPTNWPGGVFPSGSTTGVVTAANSGSWIGTGFMQDFALRQTGGYVNGLSDVALRGGSNGSGITTIYEIEDSNLDYATYTNLTTDELTLWSQWDEGLEFSLRSGHVEAGELNLLCWAHEGILNMGGGILHVGLWNNAAGDINMLSGGTGSISMDVLGSAVDLASFNLNFETGNKGSFTIEEIEGGTTAIGTWEWLIANGHVSVDGVVETDASLFDITGSGNSTTIRHIGAFPGLTVVDGTLYRDGAPYRAAGVNYCDLFQALIDGWEYAGEDSRTLVGLRYLGERGIPFVRFWACGFWPVDWDLYFTNKVEWFERMDMVVETAEEAGVGLIPSLFWRWQTYPELMGEYLDQWGNPASDTRQFMSNYVHEVVGRYKDSPAIWGWEFCNEYNLACDLPNWNNPDFWLYIPSLGVVGPATDYTSESNRMTYAIAEQAFNAFAQEVRKLDAHRFITTGNADPRNTAYNNKTYGSWTTDTYAQAKEAFGWMQPTPAIDMASIHFYTVHDQNPTYAGVTGVSNVLARYREFCDDQSQAMFVGEYSTFFSRTNNIETAQLRIDERDLLQAFLDNGADLVANWVFDYSPDRTTPGIIRTTNEYTWVLDLVREYDARMRGEIPRSDAGVPLEWFEDFSIAPAGSMTMMETEAQDLNGNGAPVWNDYFTGIHPLNSPAPVFAITDYGFSSATSLAWSGGTNGLMTPYVIQATTNPTDEAAWQTVGTKEREEGTNAWTGAASSDSMRCFRVLAVPE